MKINLSRWRRLSVSGPRDNSQKLGGGVSKLRISRRDFVALAAAAAWEVSAEGGTFQGAQFATFNSVGASSAGSRSTDSEMAIAGDWIRSFLAPAGTQSKSKTGLLPATLRPPFSFTYSGRQSYDFLKDWKTTVKTSDADNRRQEYEVTYTDPGTRLVVRVVATVFADYPAVEWVIHFRNSGDTDTPILENIQAMDAPLHCPEGGPTIHYAKGATCSMDDFMPLTRVLGERGTLHLEPGGGRSSSLFLPFFNIEAKGEGVVVAIGWTGQWATTYSRPEPGPAFRAQAGMALTRLKLHPGEEIRTPKILTLFWQGDDRRRGNNLLRQFILAHHRPTMRGKAFQYPIVTSNWGETPAAIHLENIRQIIAHDLPVDYYWIDAGWFGKEYDWWKNPGNWEVKKDLYPEGFKPISDLLHSAGRKFLLWFEPERVCAGTPWYTEHGEWLLGLPENKRHFRGFGGPADSRVPMSDPRWVPEESARNQMNDGDKLFNLGITEARKFLTDFISARINEFGIDCYRHDANIAPLEFWRAADEPDRQGITEIRWVEGFYAYWDELRRRDPNLIIDDCASGGRRIDLETIGRSTVFSRSDFVGNMEANQCHTLGLLQWVPLNTTIMGGVSPQSDYRVRSTMTAGICYGLFSDGDVPQPKATYLDFPFAEAKKSIEQYVSIQKYFYGDFYPLTDYSQTEDAWFAYQCDLPGEAEGIIAIVKRRLSEFTQAIFPLKGISASIAYTVTNLNNGEVQTLSGNELIEKGFVVTLVNRPDSAVFRYQRRHEMET
jgi:alpha-galactosidase